MIAATQTAEPTELRAGETWSWTRTLADYPPSAGWSLRYAVTDLSGAPVLQITATADGDAYAVRVEAAQTAQIKPGRYTLAGRVERTAPAEVRYVYVGELVVSPDPFGTADARTYAERMLALLQDVYEQLAAKPEVTVSINGRQVTYRKRDEVIREMGIWAAQIQQQRAGNQLFRSVEVAFVPVD